MAVRTRPDWAYIRAAVQTRRAQRLTVALASGFCAASSYFECVCFLG